MNNKYDYDMACAVSTIKGIPVDSEKKIIKAPQDSITKARKETPADRGEIQNSDKPIRKRRELRL